MATRAIDKWKTKKEFEILAPEMFNEKVIGTTYATDPKSIPGRKIEVVLAEILPIETRKPKTKLIFKVENVRGNQVVTKLIGQQIVRDYERSLVRRKTSKIYVSENVKTKDKKSLKVKAFIITSSKVNKSIKTELRAALSNIIKKESQEKDFGEFINEIIKSQLNKKIKNNLSKIYPLKHAVVQKTEVL